MANRTFFGQELLLPVGLLILTFGLLSGMAYAVVTGAALQALDAAATRLARTTEAPLPARFKPAAPQPQVVPPPLMAPLPPQSPESIVVQAQPAPQPPLEEPGQAAFLPRVQRLPGEPAPDSMATLPEEYMAVPRADRRAVQSALARLGFDPGSVDGSIGKVTRSAIRAYERSQGLPETGAMTPELAARLTRQ